MPINRFKNVRVADVSLHDKFGGLLVVSFFDKTVNGTRLQSWGKLWCRVCNFFWLYDMLIAFDKSPIASVRDPEVFVVPRIGEDPEASEPF